MLVRKRVPRVSTPPHLKNAILEHLTLDSRRPAVAGRRYIRAFTFNVSRVSRIYASVFILLLLFGIFFNFLFSPPQSSVLSIAGLASNSIIRLAHDNFELIKSGSLKPAIVTCYLELLISFFDAQNIRHSITIPQLEGCDWYGAFLEEIEGVQFVHIIYQIDDNYLHLAQVQKDHIGKQHKFTLDGRINAALQEKGCYTEVDTEECSIVLFMYNETLCVATSTMKKERILALLQLP